MLWHCVLPGTIPPWQVGNSRAGWQAACPGAEVVVDNVPLTALAKVTLRNSNSSIDEREE